MARTAKDGDWYCPQCADLQFRNNTACRHCGLAKEEGVSELTVDMFLEGHDIKEEVVEEFRSLSEDMQKLVMDRGTLKQARDPTAVLIKRMSSLGGGRPGDWWCPQCCDLQFAKNAVCRSCGAERDESAGPGEFPEPEVFLLGHDIDEDAREQFLSLEEALQKVVIMRGSLHGAKNPTAVLKSRVKQAKEDTLGGGAGGSFGMKGGIKGGKDMMMAKGWGACDPWSDPWGMKGKGMKGWGGPWDSWGGGWDSWGGYGPWAGTAGKGVPPGKNGWGEPYGGGAAAAAAVATGAQPHREGDWLCPSCGDHQFAKNTSCRKCGAPNPSAGGKGKMGKMCKGPLKGW